MSANLPYRGARQTVAEADLPLAGSVNVLPVALLGGAAAVVALGSMPRAVTAVSMVPTVGGFLLLVAVDSLHAARRVGWPSALSAPRCRTGRGA